MYVCMYMLEVGGVRPTGKSISVSVRACVRAVRMPSEIRVRNRVAASFPFPFYLEGLSLFPCGITVSPGETKRDQVRPSETK